MLDPKNIIVEDALIAYRTNFAGHKDEATGWGQEGDRTFNIWIDEPFAQQLIKEGYRVSVKEPEMKGQPKRYRIKIHVSYRFFTPKVMAGVPGSKFTSYDEEMLEELDRTDIEKCDLTLSASVAKNDGLYSFYLKEGWFTLVQSRWDKKHGYYEEFIDE